MKNGCANRTQSRACSSYAKVKPVIDEVNGCAMTSGKISAKIFTIGCYRGSNFFILHSSLFINIKNI